MDIESKKVKAVLLVKPLTKAINASMTTHFKSEILDLISKEGNRVVLNLSEVDFIDSSGLGVIISLLKTVVNNKGSFALCGIKAPILNLFSVTRLDRVFQVYETEEEAIESLQVLFSDAK